MGPSGTESVPVAVGLCGMGMDTEMDSRTFCIVLIVKFLSDQACYW